MVVQVELPAPVRLQTSANCVVPQYLWGEEDSGWSFELLSGFPFLSLGCIVIV